MTAAYGWPLCSGKRGKVQAAMTSYRGETGFRREWEKAGVTDVV